MRRQSLRAALALAIVLPASARAQAPAAVPPAAEPAPVSPPATAPPPPPAATTAGRSDYECAPACRPGFVCVQSMCVSRCNPACASGEVCTEQGQCVSACNPACAQGERCSDQGQCVSAAPAPATAPPSAPPPASGPAWHGTLMPGEVRRDDDGGEAADPRATGKRFHDGFYLRMGVGVGALVGRANAPESSSEASTGYDEVGTWGVSIPVEFALGGTPSPGIVVGVGGYGIHVPAGNYSAGRGDFAIEETAEYSAISMLGPFLDLYINPESGFHMQISPGFTTVAPGHSDKIVTSDISGIGWGVMGGLGYEGWVGEQWGMGVVFRGQFLMVELEDDSGATYDYTAMLPSLLLTATFH